MILTSLIPLLTSGQHLTAEQMEQAFSSVLSGNAAEQDISDFLMALNAKGETAEEIAAAARVMRRAMRTLQAPAGAIDVCGTGGDASGSLNISTATALVVAACGVPVAKHGNRAVSSRSGSSDVLAALGVKTDAEPAILERCLQKIGICFMAAPHFHPALHHVMAVRQKLKTRTIFNLLGPICNPAGVTRQLIGVYATHRLQPIAQALKILGSESAWVVHGTDGLDEISISGETSAVILSKDIITSATLSPEDAGLPCHPLQAIAGGNATENAAALLALLDGAPSAYRDAVTINAAAALIIAGKAQQFSDALPIITDAIDSGSAKQVLTGLQTSSNSC